jgi:ATP-dependent DNA ligase
MSLRERTRPRLGIIEPCLPSPAKAPPSGPGWIHEIKHDGFRILARRGLAGVRLITRATATILRPGFHWRRRRWVPSLQTRS